MSDVINLGSSTDNNDDLIISKGPVTGGTDLNGRVIALTRALTTLQESEVA